MTIFLYRWAIKPGKELQFVKNWELVTKAIKDQCGSYGSRLHLAANGEYIGYAQWPDLESREKCHLNESTLLNRQQMHEAIHFSYPDENLIVKSDLLVRAAD